MIISATGTPPEAIIGNLLVDTGYAPETPAAELRPSLPVSFMDLLYPL
ncbi:MAG TPA: hypothetical protein VF953_00720 [Terriglobales bacterium]